MKKEILILLMLMISLFLFNRTEQALAANEMNIMTINGSVLPEYDNKYILELYTVTMTNLSDKPYSGELTWRLPKGAMNVFVSKNEDLSKNQSIGKVRAFSNYDELYWTPKEPIPAKGITNWHIEYYNTAAIQGETEKKFTYTFKQPYTINLASLVIMQPTKATNFQLIPAPENTQQSQQGQLYGYSIKDGKPNEEKTIKVNYTKSDPNPSFSNNSSTVAIGDSTGKIQGQNGTATTPNNNKTIMLALIALIIIIAVVAIVLLNKNEVKDQISEKSSLKKDKEQRIELIEDINDEINTMNHDENIQNKKIKDKLKQELLKGMITESEYYEKLAELE